MIVSTTLTQVLSKTTDLLPGVREVRDLSGHKQPPITPIVRGKLIVMPLKQGYYPLLDYLP